MKLTDAWRMLFARLHDNVRPGEAVALLDRGAILIDVREPAEWHAGHAPAARHIPLGQLQSRLAEIPADRTVVTVCRSGMRSRQAATLLARHGRRVSNLVGGMQAWHGAGLPVVTESGTAGRIA